MINKLDVSGLLDTLEAQLEQGITERQLTDSLAIKIQSADVAA
jgi:hypothetical protein